MKSSHHIGSTFRPSCQTDAAPALGFYGGCAKRRRGPSQSIDVWANQTQKRASLLGLDSPLLGATTLLTSTAVLPKIPHSNCSKRVPNRPLRPRRGRFGTLLELLQCGVFGRPGVFRRSMNMGHPQGPMTRGFCITEGTRSALFADVVSVARSMERAPSEARSMWDYLRSYHLWYDI